MSEKKTDPKEILENTIKESQAVIDKAVAELAELGKPVPDSKHGDYGIDDKGDACMALDRNNEGGEKAVCSLLRGGGLQDMDRVCKKKWLPGVIYGNLVDDMERNSQNLQRFSVDSGGIEGAFEAHLLSDFSGLRIDAPQAYIYTIDESIKIHQNFGQMIATAQREQSNGS